MGLFSKLMKKEEKKEKRTISIREEAGCVYSPVNGRAAALESLDDGMFSEKILGDGVAVTPSDGEFVSPVTGDGGNSVSYRACLWNQNRLRSGDPDPYRDRYGGVKRKRVPGPRAAGSESESRGSDRVSRSGHGQKCRISCGNDGHCDKRKRDPGKNIGSCAGKCRR